MTWDQVAMLVVLFVGYAWVIRMLFHWKQRPQVTTRKDPGAGGWPPIPKPLPPPPKPPRDPSLNVDQVRAESMIRLASLQGPAAKGVDSRRGEQVAGVLPRRKGH